MIDPIESRLKINIAGLFLSGLLVALASVQNSKSHAQQPIVLRDLHLIPNATVVQFDDRSVRLNDGRSFGWDEILSATAPKNQQSQFDEKLSQIGLPLFRLKSRIEREDWAGASGLAESFYESLNLIHLECDDPTATTYLVCVAVMKGRLQQGDRAGAVLPFLQAAKIQQRWDDSSLGNFPRLLPREDVANYLSSEIQPIWFDPERVESSFQALTLAFIPTSNSNELGAIVYLTSMSIELERIELARDLLALLSNRGPPFDAWRIILQSQIEIAEGNAEGATDLIKKNSPKLSESTEAIGWYLKSTPFFMTSDTNSDKTSSDSESASLAMLDLLKIPAVYGERFPAISAAAIFQSQRIAIKQDWKYEAEILRLELLNRFSTSYHAGLVKKNEND